MIDIESPAGDRKSFGEPLPPVQEGIFVGPAPDGGLNLIGSSCADCGQKMFPARARCVKCFGGRLEELRFEPRGKVVSFTIVRQAPPGYFGVVPYVLGMVEIEGGVQVLTHLVGKAPESWQAGNVVHSRGMSLPLDPRAQRSGQAFAFGPFKEIQ